MNAVFRLLLASANTWPLRPTVVTYSGSSTWPSHFRSDGAIKIVVSPQSMRARMGCISPLLSLIKSSWITWDESSLDVPHKYWLDMWAFVLSNTTLDFKAIRCGCMLSIVAIKVCIPNHSKPNAASSHLFRQAKCWDRSMSFLAVDCRKTSVVWFGVLCPCLELMSGPAVVGYLLMRI